MKGESWSEVEYLAPKVNPAKSTQHNNQQIGQGKRWNEFWYVGATI